MSQVRADVLTGQAWRWVSSCDVAPGSLLLDLANSSVPSVKIEYTTRRNIPGDIHLYMCQLHLRSKNRHFGHKINLRVFFAIISYISKHGDFTNKILYASCYASSCYMTHQPYPSWFNSRNNISLSIVFSNYEVSHPHKITRKIISLCI